MEDTEVVGLLIVHFNIFLWHDHFYVIMSDCGRVIHFKKIYMFLLAHTLHGYTAEIMISFRIPQH